jgi:hypothetical protein
LVDTGGNIVLGGDFRSPSIDLGGGPLCNAGDYVSHDGYTYLSGCFVSHSIDFDGEPKNNVEAGSDLFLVKLKD